MTTLGQSKNFALPLLTSTGPSSLNFSGFLTPFPALVQDWTTPLPLLRLFRTLPLCHQNPLRFEVMANLVQRIFNRRCKR